MEGRCDAPHTAMWGSPCVQSLTELDRHTETQRQSVEWWSSLTLTNLVTYTQRVAWFSQWAISAPPPPLTSLHRTSLFCWSIECSPYSYWASTKTTGIWFRSKIHNAGHRGDGRDETTTFDGTQWRFWSIDHRRATLKLEILHFPAWLFIFDNKKENVRNSKLLKVCKKCCSVRKIFEKVC